MTRRPPIGSPPTTRREALAAERSATSRGNTLRARPPAIRHSPARGAARPAPSGSAGRAHTAPAPAAPTAPTAQTARTAPTPAAAAGARSTPPSSAPRRPPVIPRIVPLAILLAAVVALSAGAARLLGTPATAGATVQAVSGNQAASPIPATSAAPAQTPAPSTSAPVTPSPTPSASAAPPAGLTAADLAAGLVGTNFANSGNRRFSTVPGEKAAPGAGRVLTFRVQVEQGLPIDGQRFAEFVFATLNDPHSWGAGGRMRFARTDGPSDFRVVLATPQTSADLCRPLLTRGVLSCHNGNAAILTIYRWVKGTHDYGADLTDYRRYLVNHEVGHYLGHGHVMCPGRGRTAPVMMQQTKGLQGCAQNPWPYP